MILHLEAKLSKQRDSLIYFEKAENILIKSCGKWHPDIGKAFNSLAIANINAGEYHIALEYLHKAAVIRKEINNKSF